MVDDGIPQDPVSGVMIQPEWDPNQSWAEFLLDYDLNEGDEITASDELITKFHVVTSLTVDKKLKEIQNTISGTADPGSRVELSILDVPGTHYLEVILEGGTDWTGDFDLAVEPFDIERGTLVGAGQRDGDDDVTWIERHAPPSFVQGELVHNWISGNEFYPESDLSLEIIDGDGNPHSLPVTTDAGGSFWLEQAEHGVDLVPGVRIDVSDAGAESSKTLVLEDLTLDVFDPDEDTIEGTGPIGATLWVHVGDDDSKYGAQVVVVDDGQGGGIWSLDTTGAFDIKESMGPQAMLADEDGDETVADHDAPPEPEQPRFTIQPNHRWVQGHNWPINVPITLIIDVDDEPGNGVEYEVTEGFGEGEVWFDLGELEWLAPGYYVSMSDGETYKDTWIAELYFDAIDAEADRATGRCSVDDCPDETPVGVGIETEMGGHWMEALVVDGIWTADFSAEDPDFENILDANVVVWDEDGDETMAHLPPPPTLHAVPAHPEVHGHDWASDAFVTLAITRPSTGESFSASKYVYEDSWCGDPCFDLKELWDLQEGDVVTMSHDLGYTATVHVTSLVITQVDLAADTVSGTAAANSDVWVTAFEAWESPRHVTADVSGNWSADFSVPGDEEFESAVVDLMPGTDGRAIQFENPEPDDGTLAYWPRHPEFVSGSIPTDPVTVGTEVTITADFEGFTYDGAIGPITHMEYILDGLTEWTDLPHVGGDPVASGSAQIEIQEPGIYPVVVRAFDAGGAQGGEFLGFVVVYDPDGDPDGGFVTGGGWIWSPEGAYYPDPVLEGRASFGFVAKYKKGATVPSGQTEFQFHLADMNFKSTSYDWLVVAGKKAMFKGEGTINGEGEYKFMLSAIDGDMQGGDGVDRFRIRIWSEGESGEEIVVYDNQLDDFPGADPATQLGGGSIVIHKAK